MVRRSFWTPLPERIWPWRRSQFQLMTGRSQSPSRSWRPCSPANLKKNIFTLIYFFLIRYFKLWSIRNFRWFNFRLFNKFKFNEFYFAWKISSTKSIKNRIIDSIWRSLGKEENCWKLISCKIIYNFRFS